jgi:hypothetical protein
MKLRITDAVACAVGVIVAIVALHDPPWISARAWPALFIFVCPGFLAAAVLIQLILSSGLSGLAWIWPLATTTNGVLFGLGSYLTRRAVRGQRVAQVTVVLGACVWVGFSVQWTIENWPQPERPIAPFDLASPLTGRWDGLLHTRSDDRPVVLLLRPRSDGMLEGCVSINGDVFENFDEGSWAGDSVRFDIIGFQYRGQRVGTQMAMETSIYGMSQAIDLHFVRANITSHEQLPQAAPSR